MEKEKEALTRQIEDRLSVARVEVASANQDALRSQIFHIRETFQRVLHEDTTLGERNLSLS